MLMVYMTQIEEKDDKADFARLYTKYKKQMLYMAFRILENREQAEDVVHDTFLAIAKHPRCLDTSDENRVRNYLLTAVKNRAYNDLTRERNARTAVENIKQAQPLEKTVQARMESDLEYKVLLQTIQSMDERYADPLYLFYVEGYTYKETAALLGRKPTTVRKQLERGKALLIEALRKEGFIDAE